MNKNLKSYFIELLIVVFGVSIAFWLGQIAEDSRERVVTQNYLRDIQADLGNDLISLNQLIEYNTNKQQKTLEVAMLFSEADANKEVILAHVKEIGNFGFFTPEDFTYESMIASGDFKLMDNKEIKLELIKLHSRYKSIDNVQINFMQALDDNFFPQVMLNFDFTTMKPISADFHKSLTLKNFFMYTVNDLSSHIDHYKYASKSALKLDSLITVELK